MAGTPGTHAAQLKYEASCTNWLPHGGPRDNHWAGELSANPAESTNIANQSPSCA